MSQEIKNAVAAILENAGDGERRVVFTATPMGEKKNAFSEGVTMDRWLCTFTRTNGTRSEEFEFFTGIGLRAPATQIAKMQAKYDYPGLTENDIKRGTSYGRRYLARVEELRKPQAPHAADVLHSLILDSSAVGQSFDSWCADLGYDSDSRKAEKTYRACQENADKLARIFDRADIAALETAFQDY